jgi:hypothetical protein
MPRPKWPKQLVKDVFDKGHGKCHHCHTSLQFQNPNGGARQWEIDHYPVV